MMLILLAGLQSQPGDVLEAAKIDRADAGQTFRYITLPHLRQYIELSALLGSIYVLQTFDAIFMITQGGPGRPPRTCPTRSTRPCSASTSTARPRPQGVVVVIGTIIVATFALRTISSLFTEETSDEHAAPPEPVRPRGRRVAQKRRRARKVKDDAAASAGLGGPPRLAADAGVLRPGRRGWC